MNQSSDEPFVLFPESRSPRVTKTPAAVRRWLPGLKRTPRCGDLGRVHAVIINAANAWNTTGFACRCPAAEPERRRACSRVGSPSVHGDLQVLTRDLGCRTAPEAGAHRGDLGGAHAERWRRTGSSSPPSVDAATSLALRNTSSHRLEPRELAMEATTARLPSMALSGSNKRRTVLRLPSRGGR